MARARLAPAPFVAEPRIATIPRVEQEMPNCRTSTPGGKGLVGGWARPREVYKTEQKPFVALLYPGQTLGEKEEASIMRIDM
jgi:hypothetical protein